MPDRTAISFSLLPLCYTTANIAALSPSATSSLLRHSMPEATRSRLRFASLHHPATTEPSLPVPEQAAAHLPDCSLHGTAKRHTSVATELRPTCRDCKQSPEHRHNQHSHLPRHPKLHITAALALISFADVTLHPLPPLPAHPRSHLFSVVAAISSSLPPCCRPITASLHLLCQSTSPKPQPSVALSSAGSRRRRPLRDRAPPSAAEAASPGHLCLCTGRKRREASTKEEGSTWCPHTLPITNEEIK